MNKGVVLLRREISLKAICEKVKFSRCDFWNSFFVTMNGHKYKLFKNIFNDVQTEGKGEINAALYNYSKIAFLYYIS